MEKYNRYTNRIDSYFKTVMDAVTQYAVGYPYDKK